MKKEIQYPAGTETTKKEKPPLPKGGWHEVPGGFCMNRKHNTGLTENARALRKNMTKEERHLWYDFLKDYPVRFLRQKVIDQYIVDFYCHDARLIIELDGSQHYDEKEKQKDRFRTEQIEKRNLMVVRIPNSEVFQNFIGVCEYIHHIVTERIESPSQKS